MRKSLLRILLGVLSAGIGMSTTAAHADYVLSLDAPFKLNKSIVGQEGWESRLSSESSKNNDIRMVKVRWDDFKPALLVYGASVKNAFPKTEGMQVRVTLQVAFTFPEGSQNTSALQQFRLLLGGSPFGEIVFNGSKGWGLGLGDGTGRKMDVVLPSEEMLSNHYYTLTVLIDYGNSTYDVSVTGENKDGSPLSHEKKGVEFEGKRTALEGLSIISANSVRVYIRQLSIESL